MTITKTFFHQISPGVICVDMIYPVLECTCAYLLIHKGCVAIIDCGAKGGDKAILSTLQIHDIQPKDVQWLIVTHAHLDHAGSAGQLMQSLPNATLLGHPSALKHLINPNLALAPAAKRLYGENFFNQYYGELLPIDETRTKAVEDEEIFFLGGNRELKTINTYGHAWHHISIKDTSEDIVYAGDAYGISYPNVSRNNQKIVLPVTPPNQFNPEAMINSIHRIHNLGVSWAAITHFGAIAITEETTSIQIQSLEAWLPYAKKTFNEKPEKFRENMTEMLRNWVIDLAIRKGINPEIAKGRHKDDLKLSTEGFYYLLLKKAKQETP